MGRDEIQREHWRLASARIEGGSLEILGFQVMQAWEHPLMSAMAAAVVPVPGEGHVLEVGYGLGISAEMIQARHPARHWIIEANAELALAARERFRRQIEEARVTVIEAFWEDVVPLEGACFSGILFDTYPLRASERRKNHFPFFPHAARMLIPGGTFTYFSDELDSLSRDHQRRLLAAFGLAVMIRLETIHVAPTTDCRYWRSDQILHVAVQPARGRP
ncbi:MAG: hypothetical protein IT378_03585 [Sandaracinaceae bacterium]|nr:hypothetical protein [Sandaracinaceae bacterium]